MNAKIIVSELSRLDRVGLERHLLSLGEEDRRLRFGLALGDDGAELGLSVLPAHRGRGLGGALLERARTHARNWGVDALFMQCLTDNAAMMHLARTRGMAIALVVVLLRVISGRNAV